MVDLKKKYLRDKKIYFLVFSIVIIVLLQVLFKLVYLKRLNDKSDFELFNNMDVVYTWVNGSDEKFIETIKQYTDDIDPARFEDRDELKFSVRSLEKFAPWVRHVYIVTNGQIPTWLNLEYEKVSVVPHNEIAPDPEMLPTFSSNAIEQFLHRIPNLSKRFMYLNDDIFLGMELYTEDLYSPVGGFQFSTTRVTPQCAPNCKWSQLNDGICDEECNFPECEFDATDCGDGNENRFSPHKRDKFMMSIINSGKVFNLAYGLKKRNIIPHNGFLFDKDIIEEMLAKFQKEFNNTRYNKFRSQNDIQFGYSFVHYVMSETLSVTAEEIFDRFDLDKSETWSEYEMSLLLEEMYLDALNETSEQYFEKLILNCFKNSVDGINGHNMNSTYYVNFNSIKVTRNLVTKCSPLSDTIAKEFSKQSKYQFQYTGSVGATNRFALLSSNITEVKNLLNTIRKDPKRFNCIGDRTDVKDATEEKRLIIKEALDDFYSGLFPYPSKYELPDPVKNQFRYYDDYLKWKNTQKFISIFSGILVALLIFLILMFCLKLKTFNKNK